MGFTVPPFWTGQGAGLADGHQCTDCIHTSWWLEWPTLDVLVHVCPAFVLLSQDVNTRFHGSTNKRTWYVFKLEAVLGVGLMDWPSGAVSWRCAIEAVLLFFTQELTHCSFLLWRLPCICSTIWVTLQFFGRRDQNYLYFACVANESAFFVSRTRFWLRFSKPTFLRPICGDS